MVMPDKNPTNSLTDNKNKQNEKNIKENKISVDDDPALEDSEFDEEMEAFLAEGESPDFRPGAKKNSLDINDNVPQDERAKLLKEKMNQRSLPNIPPLVIVEGGNNNVNNNPKPQNNLTSKPIIIYAHKNIPTDKNPLYEPNKCIEQIIHRPDKQQFKSEKGFTVYAPTSKQAYSLGINNGTPFARLSRDDAKTNGKIDYEIAGLTLMNMIENILSRGNVVKITTSDPIMACIGKSYIEYLKKEAGLECEFTLNTHIVPSKDQLAQAKTTFEYIIQRIGSQNFKDLPWFEAASQYSPEPPSARSSLSP